MDKVLDTLRDILSGKAVVEHGGNKLTITSNGKITSTMYLTDKYVVISFTENCPTVTIDKIIDITVDLESLSFEKTKVWVKGKGWPSVPFKLS